MKRLLYLCFLISLPWGGLGWASFAQDSTHIILIETSYGSIRIKLYNETPLHRDNFLKLAEKHFYDSLLFHRVIQGFMIQGGDPDSKNALPKQFLGNGEVGYTIPAEFNPNLFHKRGALAGARNPDEINPNQESSGCQFYIVQGKVFTDTLLRQVEQRITGMMAYNKVVKNQDNKKLIGKYLEFSQAGIPDSIYFYKAKLDALTQAEISKMKPYKFSEEQKKAYTAAGGAPHLDESYTVFGEVLEGMNVVDKIAAVKGDKFSRPLTDVRMKITIIKQP